MWPWGHAAVGFLLLSVLTLSLLRRFPTRVETVTVLLATQLPDLVDKPLAWSFGLLPSGRSLAHSLLTAAVLLTAVGLLATRYHRQELLPAFGVGYVSHLLTDLPRSVLRGDFFEATYLLWPLLPSPEYSTEPTFAAHLTSIDFTSGFLLEVFGAVLVGAFLIWGLHAGWLPE